MARPALNRVGLAAGTVLLASLLAGCGDPKPTPSEKTCYFETDVVAMAFTKPCDGSTPKQIDTPESVVMEYYLDDTGFVEFTLKITESQVVVSDIWGTLLGPSLEGSPPCIRESYYKGGGGGF